MEQLLAYERKIHDDAARVDMPSHAAWLEVQYLKVHAYELVIEYLDENHASQGQVDALCRVAARIKSVENTLGPRADHFTERLA